MSEWKPITEVYPNEFEYGCMMTSGDYDPLLQSFGYETLLQVDDNDYQGDSRVLYRDGDRFGILVFGWGSCSGCDALQACTSYKEIDELRQSLHHNIRWGTRDEILEYLREHDWAGDFLSSGETEWFVEEATRLLEGHSS